MKTLIAFLTLTALGIAAAWAAPHRGSGAEIVLAAAEEAAPPGADPAVSPRSDSPEYRMEDLDRIIAEAEAWLAAGDPEQALADFGWATVLAVKLGAVDDWGYLAYRQGDAYWALYEQHGTPDYIKAAIDVWEAELASYVSNGYPDGFRTLARYDIGRAYLTLARFENAAHNTWTGLAALSYAAADMDGPQAGAIQHMLRERTAAARIR